MAELKDSEIWKSRDAHGIIRMHSSERGSFSGISKSRLSGSRNTGVQGIRSRLAICQHEKQCARKIKIIVGLKGTA